MAKYILAGWHFSHLMLLQLPIRTQAPSCETQSSTNHDPRTPSLSPSARHPLEHHRGPVQLAPAKRCGSHRGRSPEEQASVEHLWIFVAAGNTGNLLWSALGVNSGYMEKDYSQRFLLMTARSPFSTYCSGNPDYTKSTKNSWAPAPSVDQRAQILPSPHDRLLPHPGWSYRKGQIWKALILKTPQLIQSHGSGGCRIWNAVSMDSATEIEDREIQTQCCKMRLIIDHPMYDNFRFRRSSLRWLKKLLALQLRTFF